MSSKEEKINRAKLSLEGLNVGDCFGESFFMDSTIASNLIAQRSILEKQWFWTDDSLMGFSVFNILKTFGEIEQYALAQSFADRYDIERGYGSGMHELMRRFRMGEIWHEAAASLFAGQGSWGNGSAMRVAPIGAYFAEDLKKVCDEAEKSAVVTHTNEEAIVGAQAVALATASAWQFKQNNFRPSRAEFIEEVLSFLAPSETTSKIRRARDLNKEISTQHAADILGNGIQISCPDTVPFCLFCAGEFLDNYEEAIWEAVSALGDRDTTCAIVGGIVVMYSGIESIPESWSKKREPIPLWV